jgi:glutaconate CoA-transferase subunit A
VADFLDLRDAIATLVDDGDAVALEGFTHLIPFAAGHELIRQRKRDLTIMRMTPDVIYDQLIGAGCARKLIFSWGGNPGVGSLHRFREAIEKDWPAVLEIEEHSHAGMAARYVAGASGLPFGVLRGYVGTDLAAHTDTIAPITCPFTGEQLTAVPALRPDVGIVHAQQADRQGNVGLWGIQGVQKEVVLAARNSIVTVEEVVDELDPRVTVTLPSWVVSAISVVPRGAHPSYAHGYYERDNAFYRAWEPISRDRESFSAWVEQHIHGTRDFAEHLAMVEADLAVTA